MCACVCVCMCVCMCMLCVGVRGHVHLRTQAPTIVMQRMQGRRPLAWGHSSLPAWSPEISLQGGLLLRHRHLFTWTAAPQLQGCFPFCLFRSCFLPLFPVSAVFSLMFSPMGVRRRGAACRCCCALQREGTNTPWGNWAVGLAAPNRNLLGHICIVVFHFCFVFELFPVKCSAKPCHGAFPELYIFRVVYYTNVISMLMLCCMCRTVSVRPSASTTSRKALAKNARPFLMVFSCLNVFYVHPRTTCMHMRNVRTSSI